MKKIMKVEGVPCSHCTYEYQAGYGGGYNRVSKCVGCQLADLNNEADRLRCRLEAVDAKIAELKPRSTPHGRAVFELQEAEARLARAILQATECGVAAAEPTS